MKVTIVVLIGLLLGLLIHIDMTSGQTGQEQSTKKEVVCRSVAFKDVPDVPSARRAVCNDDHVVTVIE